MRVDRRAVLWGGALLVARGAAASDDFSRSDRLRALYSAEFRFTPDGLPVVPIAVTDGAAAVTLSCPAGLRLLPDGEGGPEVRADESWQVRPLFGRAARLRHWAVVWRGRAGQGAEAAREEAAWRARGEEARTFEQGALFGIAGEVLDRRERLVAIGPFATIEEAEAAAARVVAGGAPSGGGLFTELAQRPEGRLEATGARSGARVTNDGVLWFAPTGDAPLSLEWKGPRRSGHGTFHGRLYVTFDRRGELAVVNAVPEDRLLAGLVPAEIFPSAPDEALKAQAVAARNELLTKIGTRHIGDPFRLCSEVHCQVYAGAGRETPRTTAAVRATRGEVLFTSGAKAGGEGGAKGVGPDLVDTVYSANCGGHTEDSGHVWSTSALFHPLRGRPDVDRGRPGDLYAGGVTEATVSRFIDEPPDAFCARVKMGGPDRYRWRVTRSPAELERLLEPYKVGVLRAVEVLARGVSGRATAARLTGSTGSAVIRGELRIRRAFGGLRSSLFVVEVEGGAATFRGAGYGHGVGLCQTGAIGMAEGGRSYKQILAHYYPQSALRKLW